MAELKPVPEPEGRLTANSSSEDSEFLAESSSDFESLKWSKRNGTPTRLKLDLPAAPLPAGPAPAGATLARIATRVRSHWPLLVVGVIAALSAYILYQYRSQTDVERPSRDGLTTIDSKPAGATVLIDGATRGVTPLQVSLPAGVYTVELRKGAASKTLNMRVEAGESLRESVELSETAAVGRLEVTSEPPGAHVSIDGVPAGTTPLTVAEAPIGTRRVTVTANGNTVSRTVRVQPGATASVLLSPQAALPVMTGVSGGYLTIRAPFPMLVVENGEVIGTSDAARILMPIGRHDLELRAARFGFRTTTTVEVGAGRTSAVPVAVPNGTLSINASPWAEVWLDGQLVGQTPVANLNVPIGQHQIVWRHPQHGERRESVDVTTGAPARLGIDMATGRLLGR